MMPEIKKLTNKSALFTVVFCILFGFTFPVMLFFTTYGNLKSVLYTEAEINARLVSKLIMSNPEMWQFETVRLNELLSRRPSNASPEIRRIFDINNELIAESGDSVSSPRISVAREIVDTGEVIGKIEIIRSLRPLLLQTALFAIIGFCSSIVLYRWLPFRELSKSAIELKEATSFLTLVLEASSNAIVVTDPMGKVIMTNSGYEILTGCFQNEIVGNPILNHLNGDISSKLEAYYFNITANQSKERFETTLVSRDGTEQNILCVIEPIVKSGVLEHIVFSANDITERKQREEERLETERQFQQTQKLESLGVLAGGIAHDFNNLLMVIIGNCSLARMNPDQFETKMIEIEKASERAAALCRQMLEYAGQTQIAKSNVNLEKLVIDMVDMLSSTGHKNILIKPVISPNIPVVYGDASQIRQIVMNLIINATEAIGDAQGEIDVMLTKATIIGEQIEYDHLGRVIPAGEYVCLEVTDTGCGMDNETKRKIFEPFFTTKFTGRGLGLSATLGIISGHGGSLQLFSQPGKGSTFIVYLPAQTSDSNKEDEQHVASVPWQGSGTILLVEDDDQVRLIAKTILEKSGFTVIEAVNGKEALELFQQNTDKICLVITDIGMPIMDGYELFFELKKKNPELPIIISSGFGDTDITLRIPSEDMAGLISKPYNPTQLLELLKRVLEDTQVIE